MVIAFEGGAALTGIGEIAFNIQTLGPKAGALRAGLPLLGLAGNKQLEAWGSYLCVQGHQDSH